MENWILVVGYDRPHFDAARKDWLRLNVYLHSVDTATEAIEQCPCRKYLAVIASYNVPNITPLIEFMSGTNQTPLVILSQNDSGTKLAESIIRGAKHKGPSNCVKSQEYTNIKWYNDERNK